MFRFRVSVFCLSALILGGSGLGTVSAAVRFHKHELKSLDIAPSKVVGGSTVVVTGTVTLTEPADSGGDVVNLSSSDASAAAVPTSVTVPGGETSATFTVTTLQVYTHKRARIRAELGSTHKERELHVHPFEVTSFSFNPSTVTEGSVFGGLETTVGTVTLSAPAGPNGVTVQLTSNASGISLPTLTVPEGATTVNFSLLPAGVSAVTIIKFTASVGCSHQTTHLTVDP